LKDRIVEPEETTVAGQRLDKHVSAEMDTHTTKEAVLCRLYLGYIARAVEPSEPVNSQPEPGVASQELHVVVRR
jgi:hypothetical protein